MSSIGRHFNRASSSIFPHFAQFGGIRPPARKRSRFSFSLADREEISRGLVAEQSLRSIAKGLNRSPSTISREVRRSGGRKAYRAARSDQRAWDCASRPKSCKLSFIDPLRQLIARKLRRKWSPQQIAGWLKRAHPNEEQNRVSHETIYRSLYVQTRGVLKKELRECLRSPRPMVGLNLLVPTVVTAVFVKWALVGIGVWQLSTLFMQMRGGASRAAMAGPAMLLGLTVIYWFIRT